MLRKYLGPAVVAVLLLCGGLFLLASYLGWVEPAPEHPFGPGPFVVAPDDEYSNILPDDYVGPAVCAECHSSQHRRWSAHPHRFMNQLPSPAAIKGDFADHVWTVRDGVTVTFTTRDGDYLMTVDAAGRPRTRYKVTRTVGARFTQFYIGVQIEGAEPAGDPVYTTEHKLPFGYWYRLNRWLPIIYFDVVDPNDDKDPDGFPSIHGIDRKPVFLAFSEYCVHCHNTYPHAYRLHRPVLNGLREAEPRSRLEALSSLLSHRIAVEPTEDDFLAVSNRLALNRDLVTIGISCESCHLGGREHAQREKKIAFHPASPHVRLVPNNPDRPYTGERTNPATVRTVCAQCHASGVDTLPNGAALRNSAESNDLAAGACLTKISCINCHDPHTASPPSGGPTLGAHLDACISCHPRYGTPEQAAAHSRHAAGSGVNCLDCHMPRINQGIDTVARTHRISPPVEASMVTAGSFNACNLCHLDKSVGWSLDELHRGWGRDLRSLEVPNRDVPAGRMWLTSRTATDRLVAVDAHTRLPAGKVDPTVVLGSLNDPNPANRTFGLISLERLIGRSLAPGDYDPVAPRPRRTEQIEALRALLKK